MTQTGVYVTYPSLLGGSSDHCPRILIEHPTLGDMWVYGDTPFTNHNTPGCIKYTYSYYGHGGDVTYVFEDGGGGDYDCYMEIKWGINSATIWISCMYHIYPTKYYYGSYEITSVPDYPTVKETTINFSKCIDIPLEEIESSWVQITTAGTHTTSDVITHAGYIYHIARIASGFTIHIYVQRTTNCINWTTTLHTTAYGEISNIASIDGVLFIMGANGLYRSVDDGYSFTNVISGVYVQRIEKLGSTYCASYAVSSICYAATSSDGISWTTGVGTIGVRTAEHSIVFNGYMFVATGDGYGAPTIYINRSSNCTSWSAILIFNYSYYETDAYIASRPHFHIYNDCLYMSVGSYGIYKTTDGVTWVNVFNPTPYITTVGSYKNERVFAGTGSRQYNDVRYIYESPTGESGTWTLTDYSATVSAVHELVEYNNTVYSFSFALLTTAALHRLTPAPSIPAHKYFIYSNTDDPNYPGYDLMTMDGSAWFPSDHPDIGIFSGSSWTYHTNYRFYNYFHYIKTCIVDYDGTSTVYISGNNLSNTSFVANDAIMLYCEETDTRIDIPGETSFVASATDITGILQTGTNTINVFLYNGPKFSLSGNAEYYENGGVLQCANMYIRTA